ncbi:MAG: hypothetical protein NTZ20_04730 [Candidatus Levybacteria bacterium]|nr:hypothetical protein [Candidatus Levybacteria bacterium]
MPNYNFKNVSTGEEYTEFMAMEEKDKFLIENPDVTQMLSEPAAFGDSIKMGLRKPDNGFRDILKRVKSHHPLGRGINTF